MSEYNLLRYLVLHCDWVLSVLILNDIHSLAIERLYFLLGYVTNAWHVASPFMPFANHRRVDSLLGQIDYSSFAADKNSQCEVWEERDILHERVIIKSSGIYQHVGKIRKLRWSLYNSLG